MFAVFEIIDGDFVPTIESKVAHGFTVGFKSALKEGQFLLSEKSGDKQVKVSIPFSEAVEFQEIDIERTNLGDGALLGIVGALALGPLGLVAGGALGGLNKKKLFVITFQDGRKVIGKTGKLAYNNLREAFAMRELIS